MNTSRRCALALAVVASGALSSRDAAAQVSRRLYAHGEVGAGTMLTLQQYFRYSLGLTASTRVGVRIVPLLGVHATVGTWGWQQREQIDAMARLTAVGAGVHLSPQTRWGRPFLDLEASVGVTGTEAKVRPLLGAGGGWLFHLPYGLTAGPSARIAALLPSEEAGELPSQGGSGPAIFWHASVILGWSGAPSPLPPPPPPPPPPAPPRDGDLDGVLDPDDACPNVPQGDTPDPSRRGCPAPERAPTPTPGPTVAPTPPPPPPPPAPVTGPDTDHDRVADDVDRCPREPGVPSTDAAQNGCPTEVRIEYGLIRFKRQIRFRGTTDPTLRTRSERMMQGVVDLLRAAPWIRLVTIHADVDRRHPEYAAGRRNAVYQWLVTHGVEANRLRVSDVDLSGTRHGPPIELVIADPPQTAAGADDRRTRRERRHRRRREGR